MVWCYGPWPIVQSQSTPHEKHFAGERGPRATPVLKRVVGCLWVVGVGSLKHFQSFRKGSLTWVLATPLSGSLPRMVSTGHAIMTHAFPQTGHQALA